MTRGRSPHGVDIAAWAASHVGLVREQNEDSLFAGGTVFAVADGMGGHQAGEVASDTALEPIRRLEGRRFAGSQALQDALVEAISEANETVVTKAEAEPDYRGMGTTLTAAVVHDGRLHVAHVGDSRAYLLREGEEISQLTTDHTLVERLVQEGRISRDEAATHPQRSVVTRAIGVERDVAVDSLPPLELESGDQVLLCSDGLTGLVPDAEITHILQTAPDGAAACQALIDAANHAGGIDNITVVLLRIDGDHAGAVDMGDTGELRVEDADDGEGTVQIRTRQETGTNWADGMRRFGAPQGRDRRQVTGTGRGRRVLASLLAVAVLIAVLAGGGLLLLSRAYFVGVHNGQVAVFRGVPQTIASVELYRVEELSDLDVDDLATHRQRRLEDGVSVGSLTEGRRLITDLEREAEGADEDSDTP